MGVNIKRFCEEVSLASIRGFKSHSGPLQVITVSERSRSTSALLGINKADDFIYSFTGGKSAEQRFSDLVKTASGATESEALGKTSQENNSSRAIKIYPQNLLYFIIKA